MNKIYSRMTLSQLLREKNKVEQNSTIDAKMKEQAILMINDAIAQKEARVFNKNKNGGAL